MTEIELQKFVSEHDEGLKLEYKLKPNFNEIKEMIGHLNERMHFKILATIYAFANTGGGDLYVGIGEKNISENSSEYKKEKIVIGVDEYDEKIIKRILEKVTPKITKQYKIIQLKKEKRNVIKISVNELKLYEKPQLLDGILYYRKNCHTKTVKSFEDVSNIYKKEQFYRFLLNGIERNLKKIKEEVDQFVIDQFIEGLKTHISEFAKKNKIIDFETVKNAESKLKDIQEAIIEKKSQSGRLPGGISPNKIKLIDIDRHINDFIETYKTIISI